MKILFVGSVPYDQKEILRSLSPEKLKLVEKTFSANSHFEATEVAKKNPGIKLVIFLGYLLDGSQQGNFEDNIAVADELQRVLPTEAIMVAATEREHIDRELLRHGCKIMVAKVYLAQWLEKNLQ